MADYTIQRTAPTVYLDQSGSAVNGFRVTVYLPEFDETHFLQVASLDPKVVKVAADKLVTQRKALLALSEGEE